MRLTHEQTEVLLRGIVKSRVKERDGMSYVETWDIRAMMNRVFGFCNWSLISTSPTTLVFEREWQIGKDKKPGYKVAYKAELELIVHTPEGDARYAGSAIGEATMPDYKVGDAHDMAAKSAESGALKRAATNLGDQFGLSLYSGTLAPVVRKVVGFSETEPAPPQESDKVAPSDHPELPPEPSIEETGADRAASSVDVAAAAEPAPAAAAASTRKTRTQAAVENARDNPKGYATAPTKIDESLGPDRGGSVPSGSSEIVDGFARRMTSVEESMKGLDNRQRIAVRVACNATGVKNFMSPTEEDLDKVLVIVGKIARGENAI